MKVTMVLPSLDVGGMERMTADLSLALAGLGHEVSVLCTDRAGDLAGPLHEAGVPVHTPAGASTWLGLARFLRRQRPDVVHLHMAPWLKSAVGARVAGARFVCSIHGVTENLSGRAIRSLRLAAGLTHATVLVAESLRPYAADVLGVDPTRTSIIPNGIDTDRFKPGQGPSPLRARLGIPSEAFLMGTVARLSPVKNHQLLVEAVSALGDPRVHLLLAGDGECRQDLETQAGALGLADRVHFLGSVVETVPVYQALDLFVLSSLAEGMPMCILEAMACSIPIVSTDVGGIPNLLDNGRLGVLVPSGNIQEMTRVLQEATRKPASESAPATQAGRDLCVARFSTMAMARAYEEQYRV